MSILTGPEIARQVAAKLITIDPFDPKKVGPNSYDLRLGPDLRVYTALVLDPKIKHELDRIVFDSGGTVLYPNRLYLGHTIEVAGSTAYVPCITGKSSAARLGIRVHQTAGFGDVGFVGSWTLEIAVDQPVRLYPGMPIAQVYFETIEGEVQLYAGKYNGQGQAPRASELWREFKEGA